MIRRSHLNAEIACVQSASREIVLPANAFCRTGSVSLARRPAASFLFAPCLYSLMSSWWSFTIALANDLSKDASESILSFA